jgi:hypothetical protein
VDPSVATPPAPTSLDLEKFKQLAERARTARGRDIPEAEHALRDACSEQRVLSLLEHVAALTSEHARLTAEVARLREGRQRGGEDRPELPGGVEVQLGDWSQAETCLGGRSDDAIVYLTTHNGKPLGSLPLGWFREHTTFDLWEQAVRENRDDDAARSAQRGGGEP